VGSPAFGAPLLRPLLTARSASPRRRPFRREASSPRVRVRDFRRTTAGYTALRFGHESFAFDGTLALLGTASHPVSVRRLTASLSASFSPDLTVVTLRFARGRCGQLPQRTSTS